MGYWVKNINGIQARVEDEDDLSFDKVFDFCCSRETCGKCIYANNLDCRNDCYLQCNTIVDVLEKFGYKYVENDEPESNFNPDWPPICNYIGIPPETDFIFSNKIYRISLNGYICDNGIIVTNINLYGILNYPDKIKIFAPLSEDDKTMVKQLYNAFGNAKIRKSVGFDNTPVVQLIANDGVTVEVNNKYFKDILPSRDYYLADLNEQIKTID